MVEFEKVKNTALKSQRQQAIQFAKYLVNSSSDLRITSDLLTQSFQILPSTSLYESDETPEKEKGKTPVRRAGLPSFFQDAARRDIPSPEQKTEGKRESSQTTAQHRMLSSAIPASRKSPELADTYASHEPDFNAHVDTIVSKCGKSLSAKSKSFRSLNDPLHSIDLNKVPSGQNQGFIQLSSQNHFEGRSYKSENVPVNAISRLDDRTFCSDLPLVYPSLTSTSASQALSDQDSRRLVRATSFESHASHTRDSQRTRDNAKVSLSQSLEETQRRRKTPSFSDFASSRNPPSTSASASRLGMQSNEIDSLPSEIGDMNYGSHRTTGLAADPHDTLLSNAGDLHPHQPSKQSVISANPASYLDRDNIMADTSDDEAFEQPVQAMESANTLGDWCNAVVQEQQAIHSSLNNFGPTASLQSKRARQPPAFDYSQIIPEELPSNIKQAAVNRNKIWQAHGLDTHGKLQSHCRLSGPFTSQQLDPQQENVLNAPNKFGDFRRTFVPPSSRPNPRDPPICSPSPQTRNTLPFEIWEAGVLQYLSSAEVRSLRLVCKSIAEDLEPYVFRSLVAKFGPSFFDINASLRENEGPGSIEPDSMLRKYGSEINKFGIAFEYDRLGMTNAPYKITETIVEAWFGKYKWPVKEYPYFPSLKRIDKLLEENPRCLIESMRNLRNCHELALVVDSGHGWLEGPDISDLALYRELAQGGSKVFGKAFPACDRAYEEGMKQIFEWAQRNTINENIKKLEYLTCESRDEAAIRRAIAIRPYDSYREQSKQPDFEKDVHTGREYLGVGSQANLPAIPNHNPLHQQINGIPPNNHPHQNIRHSRRQRLAGLSWLDSRRSTSHNTRESDSNTMRDPLLPQWPLIFNGYNVSADLNGDMPSIQDRVSNPSEYPLLPGSLTEAQAQWIMETSWIQRTFLSAYTDAVRINADVFENVHSLHITKLSSGLLPSLSLKSFWSSLPQLKTVTLLVKPDWRVEHVPGDKLHQTSMHTRLIEAALKLAELLKDIISHMESLNNLHIGYCSGGEHQNGIFGRNQHVLPAPITSCPREWLLAQNPANTKPDEDTMFCFPHVRTLTFENCWFSPYMLETLMRKSRDTSLRALVLDSVSLTSRVHSIRTDGPLRTFENQLKCQYSPAAWLQEIVPPNAGWVRVLDKITPGRTIQDQEYDAGMINEEETPRPEPEFRGNVQLISLKSCGYVKIHGIPNNDFNQNELVFHSADWSSCDDSLKIRSTQFTKDVILDPAMDLPPDTSEEVRQAHRSRAMKGTAQRVTPVFIMQGGQPACELFSNAAQVMIPLCTVMSGFLTQCIHPVEKRILERNWGMKFGWGDDMKRWEAVEDGWFMGGTGRFSGNVYRNSEIQDAENATRFDEEADTHEPDKFGACEGGVNVEHMHDTAGPSRSRPTTLLDNNDAGDRDIDNTDNTNERGDTDFHLDDLHHHPPSTQQE